jgi:hypothetical protein
MCSRFTLKFHNYTTGESFEKDCNAYCCPECCKRKINRLRFALEKELRSWKFISFWTFTINARFFLNPLQHYTVLSEAYQDLITYLRRNRLVKRKDFRYIRVNEMHRSSIKHKGSGINKGFIHLHIFMDCFISVKEVIKLWNICVTNVCKRYDIEIDTAIISGSYVKGLYNSFQAANYITKYVTKNVSLKISDRITKKLYSKSRGCVLFACKIEKGANQQWVMIIESQFSVRCLLGLNILSVCPQILDDFYFPHGIPPPLMLQISDWNNSLLTFEEKSLKKLQIDTKYDDLRHDVMVEEYEIFYENFQSYNLN